MADIYKIAVGLSMTSNHAQVLSALSASLLHAHAHAEKLQGSLSRIKLAVGGGLAIAGGASIIGGLKAMTDHARELSKELATLKTQGLSAKDIARVDLRARETTRLVPGSTEAGNLKLATEAYSLMGTDNAIKALPALARTVQVFGAIDGKYKEATESLYSLLKSGEQMGKLMDEKTHLVDPTKLEGFLDTMARVAAATGNRVNASTLFGMVQQGAPALANMNDDGLLSMLMAAQQMGGPRAGTALTSLYQQMIGGTMTASRAQELRRLGLVGDYKVGRGGHLTFNPGSLETPFAQAVEKNPLEAMKILQSAMAKHGFTSLESQTKELFSILGRQTTQRLVSDFIRNLPNMQDEQKRIKGGQGLNDQAKTRNEEDYSVAEHNMHKAWENLMQALAGPNAIAAIGVMHKITDWLNYFTEVARNTHPETLQAIGIGLGAVGAALVGGGAVALIAALGPAGWIAAGIIGLGVAVAAIKPDYFSLMFDNLKQLFLDVKNFDFLAIVKDIAKLYNDAFAGLPGMLIDGITNLVKAIVEMFKNAFSSVLNSLNPFSRTSFEGGSEGGLIHRASLGGANDNIGGGGSGRALGGSGTMPAIPASVAMTDSERNTLGLILRHESGGRNVMNYIGDRRHTAQGYFQITNTNWRRIAPMLGITAPNAMSATMEEQARVAHHLLRYGGVQNWSNFNPALRNALRRGDRAPASDRAPPTAGPPPPAQERQIHTQVNLDGRTIARVVTRHMAAAGRYPNHIGGQDGHGSWVSPGTTLTDAA